MVRCARCGHMWRQAPPEDEPEESAEGPAEDIAPPPLEAGPRAMPAGTDLPAFPRKPTQRSAAIGWVVLAVVVIGVLGGGTIARDEIVAVWPPAAQLYELVGLEVATVPFGLELRNVKDSQRAEEGVPVLIIEGEVKNISKFTQEVPKLRAALRNTEENEIKSWTFSAVQTRLLPGESAPFVTQVKNPPAKATRVKVTFVNDG